MSACTFSLFYFYKIYPYIIEHTIYVHTSILHSGFFRRENFRESPQKRESFSRERNPLYGIFEILMTLKQAVPQHVQKCKNTVNNDKVVYVDILPSTLYILAATVCFEPLLLCTTTHLPSQWTECAHVSGHQLLMSLSCKSVLSLPHQHWDLRRLYFIVDNQNYYQNLKQGIKCVCMRTCAAQVGFESTTYCL